MEIKILCENIENAEKISEILDNDKAFLASLCKLKNCNEIPSSITVKIGVYKKE